MSKVDVKVFNRTLDHYVTVINVDESEANLADGNFRRGYHFTLKNSVDSYTFNSDKVGAVQISKVLRP